MTDPTPNGQTWVCGWTDVGANCLAGDPCDPETCGYRPVPPAPSSDERAPFADLTDEEFAVFAEGAGFDPAPSSDTPGDERHPGYPHQPGEPLTLDLTVDLARPAPSPVPEASGRPGEMVFTQGSPRPALQVLVSLTDGRPCVDAVSMLAFFRDSAAWNEVAGDPEKVAGLRAAADAMWELHGKAKAHLHDPAPSSSPVGDRGLELAGWLATCAADTLAYIEAGHRISHAEPVGDRCLTDCTEAWYVERDTLRAAIADVRALLAAADREEPTDA